MTVYSCPKCGKQARVYVDAEEVTCYPDNTAPHRKGVRMKPTR